MKHFICLFVCLLPFVACESQSTLVEPTLFLRAEAIFVENAEIDAASPGAEYDPGIYLNVWFSGTIQETEQVLPGENVLYLDAKYGDGLPSSYKTLPTPTPAGIDITCDRDLGSYPAGTSLMELFEIHPRRILPFVRWVENDVLSGVIEQGKCLWVNRACNMPWAYSDPGRGLDCTYTVTVTLDDGRKLQANIRRDQSNMGD